MLSVIGLPTSNNEVTAVKNTVNSLCSCSRSMYLFRFKLTFRVTSGGYRELFDTGDNGVTATEHYSGTETIRSVAFNIDLTKPAFTEADAAFQVHPEFTKVRYKRLLISHRQLTSKSDLVCKTFFGAYLDSGSAFESYFPLRSCIFLCYSSRLSAARMPFLSTPIRICC